MTLMQYFRNALARNLILFSAAVFSIAILAHYGAWNPSGVNDPAGERPASVHPSVALIEKHDCWTGQAPADTIPGHAVVTTGGVTWYAPADVGFGIWQDGEPGQLHAFCP